MTLSPTFWAINVWKTDAKSTLLSPSGGITRVGTGGVYRKMAVNVADDYTVDLMLEDKAAAGFSKGNYFEATYGWTAKQLAFAGYIETVTKTASVDQSGYEVTGVSALSYLADYHNGDALFASWGLGYHNWLQRCNGINAVGQPALTNQKGLLPATWRAVWVDGTFVPAGTTTIAGNVGTNQTLIPVASSNGINVTNAAVQITDGSGNADWYGLDPTNPNPDSGHIRIVAPGTIRNYALGNTVRMAPYKLPGTGDSWFTANDSSLNSVIADCKRYNIMLRMRQGSLAHNGVIEVGPLGDTSSGQIWGGIQLANQLSQAVIAYSYHPNAADAQKNQLVSIYEGTYVDDGSKIINCVWPFGHGSGDKARLIRTFTGGDPPGNGWTSYVPYANERSYYLKMASATTWDGNTYEFICFQRQDGLYQYGVINRGTNTGTNQGPPYGLKDMTLKDKKQQDPGLLLAEALGAVQYLADPVPSYVFKCVHPLNSANGLPNFVPLPGQSIDVRFTGEVHNALDISNTAGSTYGQYVDVGSYRYVKYPTVADPTDENGAVDINRVKKMQRLMSVEEQWSADGQYDVTYTMGSAPWESKHWEQALAADMEAEKHTPDPYHSFTKRSFEGIPFWFPNTSPLVYDDPSNRRMVAQAGGFTVSDIPHTNFFDNGHGVSWDLTLYDTSSWFDFWFCKPIDGTLTTVASSAVYGLFRVAGRTSGMKSGFHTTTDGVTLTFRGGIYRHKLLDNFGRLTIYGDPIRFTVGWHGGQFVAVADEYDVGSGTQKQPVKVAHWIDGLVQLPQYGAIGFHLSGGASDAYITALHATALHHPPHTLRKSVSKGQMHVGSPYSKRNGPNTSQSGGVNGTGRRYGAPLPI